jgi:hypothetical protein
MATETAGPIYDRTREPLGGAGDFRAIRGAEKILGDGDGEDWRLLGTDADPVVQEALDL